ncbi:DNA-directed RNA polymerase II largest subunit [Pseudozyma hubeiensis SY62]|uniref:DNA-directed RNA polymerase II largest subunit n=1 Tax=Pseudozyma hubeiensis (strain SY62) TaxID=1305764 RepID=R9PA84_PSEHS|nr:DNA-directed RNA polymerase II largest subunit [Pseudozyma hubeiensis SY62]GAC98283.1 DNA-directed RNA polymerase II largest subunit [Pseudozyma hubeiensis SY62]
MAANAKTRSVIRRLASRRKNKHLTNPRQGGGGLSAFLFRRCIPRSQKLSQNCWHGEAIRRSLLLGTTSISPNWPGQGICDLAETNQYKLAEGLVDITVSVSLMTLSNSKQQIEPLTLQLSYGRKPNLEIARHKTKAQQRRTPPRDRVGCAKLDPLWGSDPFKTSAPRFGACPDAPTFSLANIPLSPLIPLHTLTSLFRRPASQDLSPRSCPFDVDVRLSALFDPLSTPPDNISLLQPFLPISEREVFRKEGGSSNSIPDVSGAQRMNLEFVFLSRRFSLLQRAEIPSSASHRTSFVNAAV